MHPDLLDGNPRLHAPTGLGGKTLLRWIHLLLPSVCIFREKILNYLSNYNNYNGEAWLHFGDNDDIRWDKERTSALSKTGISISVNEVNGARTSTETRPKNMRVIYIMKVC